MPTKKHSYVGQNKGLGQPRYVLGAPKLTVPLTFLGAVRFLVSLSSDKASAQIKNPILLGIVYVDISL